MTEREQTELQSAPDLAPQETEVLTPGARLAQVRDQQGLSMQAVVSQLRITRSKLIALESDNYEQFPSDTFVKGYIRAYSRLLGLDEEQLISQYLDYQRANTQVSQLMQAKDMADVPLAVNRQSLPLFAVAALLVLGGVFMFWPADQAPRQVVKSPATANALNAPSPAPQPAAASIPSADQNQPGLTAQDAVAVQDAAQVAPAAVAVDATQAEKLPDVLQFDIGEDCWVEVSDAKGDVLATELMAAGSRLRIEGQAPFSVMLGNVRAVQMSINGRPVQTEPKAGNRALRFSVE